MSAAAAGNTLSGRGMFGYFETPAMRAKLRPTSWDVSPIKFRAFSLIERRSTYRTNFCRYGSGTTDVRGLVLSRGEGCSQSHQYTSTAKPTQQPRSYLHGCCSASSNFELSASRQTAPPAKRNRSERQAMRTKQLAQIQDPSPPVSNRSRAIGQLVICIAASQSRARK